MKTLTALPCFVLAVGMTAPLVGQDRLEGFLDRIRSEDDLERMEARKEAASIGPRAVSGLAKIIESGAREPRITARHALTVIVHHAGRPGAAAERAPVLRELEKVALSSKLPYLRRECVWLMGFIGGDGRSVEVAAGLLGDGDRHVAENARLALERFAGDGATRALVAAIARVGDDQRRDLLYSLAKRGDARTAGVFVGLCEVRSAEVRFAALEGLARLGSPEGVGPLTRAVSRADDPMRRKLFGEYLRLADALFEGSDRARGIEMYSYVVANAPADFHRERALHRLCPRGDDAAVDQLITGLDDSSVRVRRLAIRRLAALEGPAVTAALVRGFEGAKAASRPILLRALVERDAVAARPLIARAAASDEVELRIVGLDLGGRLATLDMEARYLEVAQSGSDAVRATALKGYVLVAEKRLEGGEKPRSFAMFLKALGLTNDATLRSRSLRGMISAAEPENIDALAPFLGDSILAVDAANGYIALAVKVGAGGDVDAAEKRLMRIATGTFPRDVITRAAAELRKLGRDPQRRARARGFVLDWFLTGPVQDADGQGLGRELEPERKIDLGKVWRIGPRRYRWKKLSDLALDGRVNLLPVFRRGTRVLAYAYTELDVDSDREVLFKMGSDDGMACWVNGERVHYVLAGRSLVVDQDVKKVKLRKGKNRVLLKIQQGESDWEFALRITDLEGEPLDLGRN